MKRRRLSDKAYVCLNLQPFTTTTQFYITRKFQKPYSGTILNEGTTSFDVQLESQHGYTPFKRTLTAGQWIELRDYPLSGITFYGKGVYTIVVWAPGTPWGFVRTSTHQTISVDNFPVIPGPPYGVNVLNWPATFPATQSGAWTVAVNNFPASYPATQSGAWTVGVNNFPAGFNVNNWPATFAATQSGLWNVGVNNWPAYATQVTAAAILAALVAGVPITNWPASYPATQSGAWTVGVNNFPASYPATQSGAWTVGVNNFPAGFNVNNWPATFAATESGAWTVGVNNFPSAFAVTPPSAIGEFADITPNGSATRFTAASTSCKAIVVRALSANTNVMRVGDGSVDASHGAELSPGDSIPIAIDNVNKVYVYAPAGADKASMNYVS